MKKQLKKAKSFDLGLIGVLPEYEMKGVVSILIYEILKLLSNGKYEYAETNLTLETNSHIINQWKSFESRLHKRRRAYIKKFN